ncbi:hypothetical protein ACH4E7_21875 [Kitasatospora sp. NPDC018058]|uniref:hypothetical protein n=1 Tax=Kitasatospora sp. NPDC018058 TaxID=3364025 RepID=UPI0037BF3D5C
MIGIIVASVVSLATAGSGYPWPSYLLLGAALLIGFASVGHIAGSWIKSQFTAPLVSGFGSLILIAWAGSPTALGLYAITGSPFQQVSPTALTARCLVAVILATAAILVQRRFPVANSRMRNKLTSRGVPMAAFCALLVVSVLGLEATSPLQEDRAGSPTPVCTGGNPKICLWSEDQKYLAEANSMAERMQKLPAGSFVIPEAFFERGLRGRGHTYQDFYILEGSMWDPSETLASGILYASRPSGPGCSFPKGPRMTENFRTSDSELLVWLSMRIFGGTQPSDMHGGPPGVDSGAITQLLSQPEDTQAKWVQERVEAIHRAYCG